MDEAEALADRLVIIDHGRVVAEGTPHELTRHGAAGHLQFTAPENLDLTTLAAALPAGFTPSEATPGSYVVEGDIDPSVLVAVTTWCADQGVLVTEIRVDQRRLEDVFLDLTGRELRG